MPRRKQIDIENEWYDRFAKWSRQDREAALKVLTILHNQLPDNAPASVTAGER